MPYIKYDPLPKQELFHLSEKENVVLIGGQGSGKTYSLCMKALDLASQNYGLNGGLLCPSLKMFKRDVLPTLSMIANENNFKFYYNKVDSEIVLYDTENKIFVYHSEDDGASIAGSTLAFGLVNEVTLCSINAVKQFFARIRMKKANKLQRAMSGTFEGFTDFYDLYLAQPRADTEVIYASTRDNIHVSDDYVKQLEAMYDETMQRQYIDGELVMLGGMRAAWSFNRLKHVVETDLKSDIIWISMDFNISPMSATIWYRMPIDSSVYLYAFDEICLRESHTDEVGKIIAEKYGLDVTIYPDPAGNARSTKSGLKSDIQILRDIGFTKIKYRNKIRSVKDCLASMNNMFDKGQLLINPKCKNLIQDLDQCKLKDNGLELDKTNMNRTHWLDGLKDMCEYEWPIIKPVMTQAEVW